MITIKVDERTRSPNNLSIYLIGSTMVKRSSVLTTSKKASITFIFPGPSYTSLISWLGMDYALAELSKKPGVSITIILLFSTLYGETNFVQD